MNKLIILIFVLLLFPTSEILGENLDIVECPEINLEEIGNSTKVKPSTPKLLFTEMTSVFDYTSKSPTESFQLFNIGEETAQIRDVVIGEMILKEQSSRSIAPEYLSQVFTSSNDCNQIKKYEETTVNITRDTFPEFAGSWTGKILILGYNFEPVEMDLELIVKHNPFELISFSIFGALIAVSFGFFMTWRSLELKQSNEVKEKMTLLNHLNEHIKKINNLRNKVAPDEWSEIREDHRTVVHNVGRRISNITKDLEQKYTQIENSLLHSQEMFNNHEELSLLEPKEWDAVKLKDIPSKELQITNIIFAIIAIVAAIPLTIFATDYFLGVPVTDILIAIGIGFSVYRTKDLGKIIKNIFKP